MKTVWKVLLGAALVVPMVAYVAGTLVASAADDPTPRETIQIEAPSPSSTPSTKPTDRPSGTLTTPPPVTPDDDVEVIVPNFEDFDDDDDEGDDDGDDRDDRDDQDDQDDRDDRDDRDDGDDD